MSTTEPMAESTGGPGAAAFAAVNRDTGSASGLPNQCFHKWVADGLHDR